MHVFVVEGLKGVFFGVKGSATNDCL